MCRCFKRQNLYWISEENEKAQECSMKFEARNAKSAVGNSYAIRNTIGSAMGNSYRNAVGHSRNARDMHMFGKCKQKWIKVSHVCRQKKCCRFRRFKYLVYAFILHLRMHDAGTFKMPNEWLLRSVGLLLCKREGCIVRASSCTRQQNCLTTIEFSDMQRGPYRR